MNHQADKLLLPVTDLVTGHSLTNEEGSFAITYGSSARGSETSDYDLLVVSKNVPSTFVKDRFTDDLIALHHAHNRALDEEVPYDNKLFYSHAEAEEALSIPFLAPLNPGVIGVKYLDQMHDDDTYFSSPEMKQRLLFNALTSDHVFLAGDQKTYIAMLQMAQNSIEALVRHLRSGDSRPVEELLHMSQDGISGKDYLGYVVLGRSQMS